MKLKNLVSNTKLKLIVSVLLMISVLSTISYGAFLSLTTQNNDNTISTSCFNTTITGETNSILLEKSLPISDTDAMNTIVPYTFTITNTCNTIAEYYVVLSSKDGSFSDNYIKYNVEEGVYNILGSAPHSTFASPTGYENSYIIGKGTLINGQSSTISLRVWIDESADYQGVVGKSWRGKIKVVSTAYIKKGDFGVIAYTENNQPTQKSLETYLSDVASGSYTATFTCTNGASASVNSEGKIVFDTITSPTQCSVNFKKVPKPAYCVNPETNEEITCPSTITTGTKIATGDENQQRFYVISNNNGRVRALAEYNLNVGSNKNTSVPEELQHESVKGYIPEGTKYGNVAFNASDTQSTNYTDYSVSSIKGYVDTYLETLNGSSYGNGQITSANLISYNELESLGCIGSSYTCTTSTYPWVYTTAYWSGSAYSNDRMWVVYSSGSFTSSYYGLDGAFGVRPVITLREGLLTGELINFTIAGVSYQAEKGMTWGEWVNSKYNTNNGYFFDDTYSPFILNTSDEEGIQTSKCSFVDDSVIISNNFNYTKRNPGGCSGGSAF